MNVSFTGIQNVGAARFHNGNNIVPTHAADILMKKNDYIEDYNFIMNRISLELTNQGKKDLSKFKEVFTQFPNKYSNNFLKFDIVRLKKDENYISDTEKLSNPVQSLFFLNSKQIEMKDKNLGLFSKISVLLKRIAGKEEIPLNDDYIGSYDQTTNFYDNLYSHDHAITDEIIKKFDNESYSRKKAQEMLNLLTDSITEYVS